MSEVQPSPPVCLIASEECTKTNVYCQQLGDKNLNANDVTDAIQEQFPTMFIQIHVSSFMTIISWISK